MFEDFSLLNLASLGDIRSLYKTDQHSVVKLAPRLTAKSCYPSNFERQNVNLALKFSMNLLYIGPLTLLAKSRSTIISSTAKFVDLILKILKIFNVNVPNKYIRLIDEYSKDLEFTDPRFTFLSKVVDWLGCWSLRSEKSGKLSARTFTYFKHSF